MEENYYGYGTLTSEQSYNKNCGSLVVALINFPKSTSFSSIILQYSISIT